MRISEMMRGGAKEVDERGAKSLQNIMKKLVALNPEEMVKRLAKLDERGIKSKGSAPSSMLALILFALEG